MAAPTGKFSVISDGKLVQAIDDVTSEDEVGPSSNSASNGGFIVNSYSGYSKKGYAPYNPKKKNQDALIMLEDPKTRSLFLCVMDGHGEDGDKISQHIKSKLSNYLFAHKQFATNVPVAIGECLARCEAEVLRGRFVQQVPCLIMFVLVYSCAHCLVLFYARYRRIYRNRFLRNHFHRCRNQGKQMLHR